MDEIREYLGVESLGYLSEAGLRASVAAPDEHCYACFTARYPVALTDAELREESSDPAGRERLPENV
jgi:glutamine phosphoribosylpyrophosphate amidotransferase